MNTSDFYFYGSIAVLLYYFLTKIFGFLARKINWHWWYSHIYLNSLHWKFLRFRKKVQMLFTRGSIRCEKCGSYKRLQIHHINYKRLGNERLSDLQIICNNCHRKGSGKI